MRAARQASALFISTLLETAVNEKKVIALFNDWNDALATGDPDVVTQMYADNAVLLPTVSNKVRHNHPEIRESQGDCVGLYWKLSAAAPHCLRTSG